MGQAPTKRVSVLLSHTHTHCLSQNDLLFGAIYVSLQADLASAWCVPCLCAHTYEKIVEGVEKQANGKCSLMN